MVLKTQRKRIMIIKAFEKSNTYVNDTRHYMNILNWSSSSKCNIHLMHDIASDLCMLKRVDLGCH